MYQVSRYDFDINYHQLKFRECYTPVYHTVEDAESVVSDLMTQQAIREDEEGLEFDGDIHCYGISNLPDILDAGRGDEEVEIEFTLYTSASFCPDAVNIVGDYCENTRISFKTI